MGHVPYVGFATYRRATVRTCLCLYKKKKKKKKRVVTLSTLPIKLRPAGHTSHVC
jgi:hypothetical protein